MDGGWHCWQIYLGLSLDRLGDTLGNPFFALSFYWPNLLIEESNDSIRRRVIEIALLGW
jgi:hypothetical protein